MKRPVYRVRISYVSPAIWGSALCVILLIGGMHTGMIVLLRRLEVSNVLTIGIVLLYWLIIAMAFTVFTRWQMKKVYEDPVKQIAEFASQIAKGDFSLYLPPYHSSEKYDFLDMLILDLNKLEKQAIVPQPESYDLCLQLSECALQFERVWEEKEITFEVDLDERVTIQADESLMELVWTNLLSNAFKFTERGGTVALRQTTEEDAVAVGISDTGCGMSEETQEHIFDKFYQGDTSRSTEGNGLGLALVQRILLLMNCTISVRSVTGEGSVFTVRIPIETEPKES